MRAEWKHRRHRQLGQRTTGCIAEPMEPRRMLTAAARVISDVKLATYSPLPVPATTVVGNTLYFIGDDGVHGFELWRSDGTPQGTAMVVDLNPGAAAGVRGAERSLLAVGDTIYFCGNDGLHGFELWKTDGTADGTSLVKDLSPGAADG